MARIDLTGIPIQSDPLIPIDRSAAQEGSGGTTLQVDRLGARWSIRIQTPKMAMEPHGRRWQALLLKAKKRGAMIAIGQGRLNIGAPGSPVVAANTAAGRLIPVQGFTPNYAARIGQFVSIIHDGRRYFDQLAGQVIANADGEAELDLQNFIRTPLSAGDIIEFRPILEGIIPEQLSLERPLDDFPAQSFSIVEEA